MAETTIRWACTEHVIDLISRRLDGVSVYPGWPGDKLTTAEMVWVSELDGEIAIPVMTGGRKQRDDKFTIPLQVRVTGRPDLSATMGRLSEIVATVEDVLASDSTLGDWDGVVSAEITGERFTATETPSAYVGFAEVVVSIHARLL